MTAPILDSLTTNRLALIRLLYLQGVDQSHLPEPMLFTSVLSFHDAAELFLGLVADRYKVSLKERITFLDHWDEIKKSAGVDLSGKGGMDRLNRLRNGFKHAGALPGRPAVEQARAEVTSFLEDNTLKVFGVPFDSVDLVDVVPQQNARDRIKDAASANDRGDRIEALAQLVQAFDDLLNSHVQPHSFHGSPFSFGPTLSYPMSERDMIQILHNPAAKHLRSDTLPRQIATVTTIVTALQTGMRVIALGIDYAQYHRFQVTTPDVFMTFDGTRHVAHAKSYAPTAADFDFCRQFVITTALRVAEAQAQIGSLSPTSRYDGR